MEKAVKFSQKITIQYMYCWTFAYRAARKRYWEEKALDRARFERRIEKIAKIIEPVLKDVHRFKMYKERFQ